MAENNSLIASYNSLPFVARVLLQLFFGYIISGVYRIVAYLENQKDIVTLVVGIVALVTGLGNAVAWIVDLVTLITQDKYVYFAE